MTTHETDPTKHLECYVSFDPAIDRAAMGRDFDVHFGATGERVSDIRYGTRDKSLLRFIAGKRPSLFVLRPLRAYERAQCDSLPTAESRWLRAISYALVRAEVSPPLSWKTEAIFPRDARASEAAVQTLIEVSGLIRELPTRAAMTASGARPSSANSAAARRTSGRLTGGSAP